MSINLTRRGAMFTTLAALAAPALVATPGYAAPDPTAVMRKARQMRRGLTNSVSNVTMTIKSGGRTTTRKMRQYVLEVAGSGNRTINVFSSPADVQGVSVLTHSALDGNDQQWLYLPSVGRVKRISSSNRSGAFVGSDFAYEDLSSFEVEKYVFSSAEETALSGKAIIVVSYKPRYKGSGYTQLRSFIDTSNYQPVQVQYFNRRGEHAKTLSLTQYKSYGGGAAWRPHRLVMQDHRAGSLTQIDSSPFSANGTGSSSFNANRFQSVS